uniref:Zinc-alpha-2-glycoprotein n=1 Tax=Oncorhynchus kisutch TaxID=8019 RepID=A0A8C7LE51_ONCKI
MFRYLCIFMLFSLISQSDVKLGSEEEHILEYMYTFFNSSHYEVVGLLDGEPVDFYSSVLKSPVPKKIWNEKERSFGNQYWQDHITSRQKIDKWFLSGAEDLKMHMTKNQTDPLIYTVPRGSLKPGHNNLTCLVTGTYPSSSPIEINLFRNNVNLTEMEGVRSSGVRPNEDNTYQLRKTVMINASESEVYQCVVNHKSFPGTRKNTWEVKKHSEVKSQVEGSAYIGLFVFLLPVFIVVVVWILKNRQEI